jgi:hypothetical protein
MAVVFVLLAHYRGCKDRDTCNVHISQMASPRTAATPSTFRYGKSEDGYQKSKVVAKDRYRRSGSFHIVLSGYRAHCSGEESGTTAQEADLNATMLSPTALPLHHSRLVFLEVRHHMIAVTLQCAVRPSPNNTSTSTKCPYNPLRNPNPIHATTTPSRVKTCSIRKLPPTTMTVIHIGRYRTTNRLHPHLISKKKPTKTHTPSPVQIPPRSPPSPQRQVRNPAQSPQTPPQRQRPPSHRREPFDHESGGAQQRLPLCFAELPPRRGGSGSLSGFGRTS